MDCFLEQPRPEAHTFALHRRLRNVIPYIAQIVGEPSGVLKGKAAVAAYWNKALERTPTLHFELHLTLVGAESLVIYYRGVSGMAAEIFFFDPHGKVARACAHYAKKDGRG